MNYEVFKSHSWWEKTLLTALCEHWYRFPSIFSGDLSQPYVVFSLEITDQDQLNILWDHSEDVCRVLSLWKLSPFQHSLPTNYSCCSRPRLSAVSPRLKSACWAPREFFLYPAIRNSFQGVSWAVTRLTSFVSCCSGISVLHSLTGSS